MIRRPPRSTLFPYTTPSDLCRRQAVWPRFDRGGSGSLGAPRAFWRGSAGRSPRSEEHTSELQSRLHLVCRLLLEKKNKINMTFYSAANVASRDTQCSLMISP